MFRFAMALLVVIPMTAAAASDPQPSEPYCWRILVRTPKHPLFTEAFREQLSRELVAALQPGLGLLGSVEVIDTSKATKTFAKSFHETGWSVFEAAKMLDGIKYHGLNIEQRDGAFVLTARQYDGFTGLTTPLLKTRTVRSLDQIPRAAGMLIEPDFSPVAMIERHGTDESLVILTFRGHTLVNLNSRVKTGDIFAVSIVKESNKSLAATAMAYTFLKTIEPVRDGKAQCRILSRWASPFGRDYRRAAALRAMKLTTLQRPLKVQLVDRAGKPHTRAQITLTASDIDFTANATDTDKFEWRDGLYHSVRPFVNVACFNVSIGSDAGQLFPVPILNDDVITLSFDIDATAQRRAEFLRDCTDLRARVAELSSAQLAMVTSMNQMLDTAQNKDALRRAEAGKASIAALEKSLGEEAAHLLTQPGVTDPVAKDVLESCTRQLAVIRDGQSALAKTIESLKTAIGNAGSPGALEKDIHIQLLVESIEGHLKRGDIPEALTAYDKLIALKPSQTSLKDEREKLNAEWATKDDTHRVARDAWRVLAGAKEAEDFKTACEAIKKAVPVMQQRKDKYGLRKLHNSFEPAIAGLYALLAKYDNDTGTEKNEQQTALSDLLGDLRQCEVLVRLALKDVLTPEKKK